MVNAGLLPPRPRLLPGENPPLLRTPLGGPHWPEVRAASNQEAQGAVLRSRDTPA